MSYLLPRVSLLLAACVALPACDKPAAAPAPPAVSTSRPLVKDIIEWDVLTGRLQATQTVEVRARVSGFLQSIGFKDGATVQKGDLLFVIDPRPYQAAMDRAEADVRQAEAHLSLTQNDLARGNELLPNKAISQEGTTAPVRGRGRWGWTPRAARATAALTSSSRASVSDRGGARATR
jgi:multidrug efflux system membrane fusion protein